MDKKTIYKVGVVSLGCDKNRVDTENMMTILSESGNFNFTGDIADSDVIIINTCSFIQSARDESNETIKEMIHYRKNGQVKCLVVTGCYPQKYIKDLTQNYPEVDIFLGTNEYKNVDKIIYGYLTENSTDQLIKTDSPYCLDELKVDRLITTPNYTAYLKIADGCDNFCSYCTIPYIRGRYRSRKMENILDEAKRLVKNGAKELILVAQDIAKYGIDIYNEIKLVELLKELEKINGLVWIRLLYCYPENISKELIEEINRNKKVCKYIDVPFQHVSDNILKAMNRHVTKKEVEKLVDDLKSTVKGITIRSTFILGFPGETKKEFNELLEFIKNKKIPNVGFFTYSREDGTVAARLDGQVSETAKKGRLLKIAKAQKKIITEYNKSFVGETLKVMVEGYDEKKGLFFGRTEFQAPEIDTLTYFTTDKDLYLGEMKDVLIVKTKEYDLYGVIE